MVKTSQSLFKDAITPAVKRIRKLRLSSDHVFVTFLDYHSETGKFIALDFINKNPLYLLQRELQTSRRRGGGFPYARRAVYSGQYEIGHDVLEETDWSPEVKKVAKEHDIHSLIALVSLGA